MKDVYATPVLLSGLNPGGIDDQDIRPSMGGGEHPQDPWGDEGE